MIAALTALLFASPAHSESLPGVSLPFVVDTQAETDVAADAPGVWALGEDLPEAYRSAGVAPGWRLISVDGIPAHRTTDVARAVATGPERTVQLALDTPEGETVLVVKRSPLVQVSSLGVLPFPAEFVRGEQGFQATVDGTTGRILDRGGVWWELNAATGALTVSEEQYGKGLQDGVSEVWWHLSAASWAVLGEAEVGTGDLAWAQQRLNGALLLRSFQGADFDHLLVPEADGIGVYAVSHPRGTPELPTCDPAVPETCLVAGRAVRATLLDRPGGRAAATDALGLACSGGVYRGCIEAVSLAEPRLEEAATQCTNRDVGACHRLGAARLDGLEDGAEPDDLTVGVLEYACAMDSSGSLGDRLRRVEAVGEGCMMLARAFDARAVPDRALLSLDQACMLGRAEACDEATKRRAEAFAMRTVRECEDAELPVAPSCTQLGHLLDERDILATELDAFGAYLRACELGDDAGCIALGDFVDRWGIAHPRVVEAEATLSDACRAGEQRACVGSAHLLVRHEPRTEAYGQALVLFDGACAAGIAEACVAGAEQRRKGSAKKVEAPEPVGMWTAACELASPEGCLGLGERLSRKKADLPDAFAAWTRACDIGASEACTDLGQLVVRPHDPAWPAEQAADAYLTRACDQGDAEGCYWLAADEVPKKGDPPEPAYLLLEESCEGDYGLGCATLADVHLGRQTSFDDEIAAGHLEHACDAGHFDSCRELGTMYLKGKGVEKDRLKAKEFTQRYSVNARRRHVRAGVHLGFPYLAGGELELVAPIPVGPAIAVTGSFSYVPAVGSVLLQLEGDTETTRTPALSYIDAGVRVYPNNKARGLYGMAAYHKLEAVGDVGGLDTLRQGGSVRIGIHSENKLFWSRVEMGLGTYGNIVVSDFDEDETGEFPLLLSVLGFSAGLGI